jgi:hypothetical protein
VTGRGDDIAAAAAQAPFNLLITRSLLLLSINGQPDAEGAYVVVRRRAFNLVQSSPAGLRDLAKLFAILWKMVHGLSRKRMRLHVTTK